jgi:hypothetical protein
VGAFRLCHSLEGMSRACQRQGFYRLWRLAGSGRRLFAHAMIRDRLRLVPGGGWRTNGRSGRDTARQSWDSVDMLCRQARASTAH